MIICTRNRAASLSVALESLAAQIVPWDLEWEVVVVDNGSSDGTRNTVATWAAKLAVEVRYVLAPTPGLARARNAGVVAAAGETLAFTDDDVFAAADWVAQLRGSMLRTAADIIGGRVLPRWLAPPPPWLRSRSRLWGALALIDHDEAGPAEFDGEHPAQRPGRRPIWGANFAVHRSVFDDVGGFDVSLGRLEERLFSGEDTDFVKRALAAGKRVMFDPALVVHHRIPPQRLSKSHFRRRAFAHGEQRGRRRIDPRSTVLGASPSPLRSLAIPLARWIRSTRSPESSVFERELEFWASLGFLWGRSRPHLDPGAPATSGQHHGASHDLGSSGERAVRPERHR